MLQPDSVYGYAHHDDVDDAITKRLGSVSADKKEELALMLGQAVAALSDINQSVPVQSKHRHLIANALENFANGTLSQDTHSES